MCPDCRSRFPATCGSYGTRGISVWLVGLDPEVLAAVRRSPFGLAVGEERMFFNLDQVVARHLATEPTR